MLHKGDRSVELTHTTHTNIHTHILCIHNTHTHMPTYTHTRAHTHIYTEPDWNIFDIEKQSTS